MNHPHVLCLMGGINEKDLSEGVSLSLSVSQGQRSDVDCQRRWQQIKNPELVKGPWTQEEDERVKTHVTCCHLTIILYTWSGNSRKLDCWS